VRDSLRGLFLTLTDDDVRVAIMGETGADVKLSAIAKKLFPYDIECKNTEGWKKLYDAYDQADGHGDNQPIVFIKMNRRNPLVIVDAKHFLRLNNAGFITDPVKVEYLNERKR
jgi:hypothetical protein|tara:strand:+ start:1475 stop:1813 length:339 start_codon:yes stop_codon:yes gene_type:complete